MILPASTLTQNETFIKSQTPPAVYDSNTDFFHKPTYTVVLSNGLPPFVIIAVSDYGTVIVENLVGSY